MKRFSGWTLAVVLVVSVVGVPVASAAVERTQDRGSWVSSLLHDALGWLSTAISGADESATSQPPAPEGGDSGGQTCDGGGDSGSERDPNG